ncbi:MAG: tandem-95 repeat protein [Desulfobacterales bacterium]|nr:tandem-95 repeat protein [Desulfobacterales bacterium]
MFTQLQTDENGNVLTDTEGNPIEDQRVVRDVWFFHDPQDAVYEYEGEVPPEVLALPEMAGKGRVMNLSHAMAEDGVLQAAVTGLLASKQSGLAVLRSQADALLALWTRTDHIAPDKTRGTQEILNHNYADPQAKRPFRVLAYARDIAILESFAGRSFEMVIDGESTTDILTTEASRSLNDKYEYLRDSAIINLIAQDLYGKDVYALEEKDLDYETLYSRLENDLLHGAGEPKTDAAHLLLALVERDRRSVFNHLDPSVLSDTEVDTLLKANGIVLVPDGQGSVTGTIGDKTWFGDGSDTIYGNERDNEIHAGGGNDKIEGSDGDDVIYGGDGNDIIDGGEGNDFLFGGAGNDVLNTGGGYGHDVMDGGAGDDILQGSHRSSTYVYVYGEGNDTIQDSGQVGVTPDVLRLRGIRAEDLKLEQKDSDLIIIIKDLGSDDPLAYSGSIRIVNAFGSGKIERFELEDGVLSFNDLLDRGGFNDSMYFYNLGDGERYILDNAGVDALYFGEGISPGGIAVRGFEDSRDLVIAVAEEGKPFEDLSRRVTIQGGFATDKAVERFFFSDGTEMNLPELLALQTSGGDDLIRVVDAGGSADGGAGNDSIYGGAGADLLAGGTGVDMLLGDGGDDTYSFYRGDGRDTVIDSAGADILAFGGGIAAADLAIENEGNDIVVGLVQEGVAFENLADQVTIKDWYLAENRVESFTFSDGTFLDTSGILSKMTGGGAIYGLETDDTIAGSESADFIYGRGGNDILFGYGGNDELHGESGNDRLDGGTGNDILKGYGGDDFYAYNKGDGRDIVADENGPHDAGFDTLFFGSDIVKADLTVVKDGLDVVIGIKEPGAAFEDLADTIRLKDWYYTEGLRRIDRFVFNDGTELDAAGLVSIMGTSGEDEVAGVETDTAFFDTPGDDRYFGKSGNDAYFFTPGSGKDEISDGGGTDRVVLDAAIAPEDLSVVWQQGTNDIEITFAGSPSDSLTLKDWYNANSRVETFEFLEGTVWNAADFLTAMGTEGEDVFNGVPELANTLSGRGGPDIISGGRLDDVIDGGTGDDGLDGQEGEDTLIGGAGADHLWGGPGSDTYVFDRGDGKDIILDKTPSPWNSSGGSADTLRFVSGIGQDHLLFKVDEKSDHLHIGVVDPSSPETPFEDLSDTITIENWYLGNYRIERIELTETGQVLTPADVLAAMGTDGDDTIKALSEGSVLDGGEGDDTLYGNLRSDTLSGSAGDDVIFGRGGADILAGGEGADFINGEEGDDTYCYSIGDGSDTIEDRYLKTSLKYGWTTALMRWDYYEKTELMDGGQDSLVFGDGINTDSLAVRPVGNNLVLAVKEGDTAFDELSDRITIQNFFSGKTAIEQFIFSDGTVLDSQGIVDLMFTEGDDNVAIVTDEPVVLSARGGNDTVLSGTGDDIISGGAGNDVLNGNDGDDVYLFARGDGRDVIGDRVESSWWISSAGNDTLRFAEGIAPEHVVIFWGGALTGWNQDGTTWENHDLDLAVGLKENGKSLAELSDRVLLTEWFNRQTKIEKISFADGTSLDAQQMLDAVFTESGDFVDVQEADLGHTFNTGAGDDEIFATEGDDTVRAGEGNDLVIGREGEDKISGGDGHDILYGDEPLDQGEGQLFGFKDNLYGGAGNDVLSGGGGSDVLEGGTGEDQLFGGAEDDSYRFSRGDGADEIFDRTGFEDEQYKTDRFGHGSWVTVYNQVNSGEGDRVVFGEGISPEDVIFVWAAAKNQDGTPVDRRFDIGTDDLVVVLKDPVNPDAPIDTLTDRITIKNFFTRVVPWAEPDVEPIFFMSSISPDGDQNPPYDVLNAEYVNRIERFVFADGTVLARHDLNQAMGSDRDDRIEAVLFEDSRLAGLSGDDILVGHVGDDELFGGEGDDRLEASYGENFMDGGEGDDTYVLSAENTPPWDRLTADDLIVDGDGADRVLFLNDIPREDIYFTLEEGDLVITYGIEHQNTVRIAENSVERFETSDGSFITREQVTAAIDAVADGLGILPEDVDVEHMAEDVTLKALQYNAWTDGFVMQLGDPEWNEFAGNSENEIVHGGEEYDDLFGHSGNDILYGHHGDDWLNAGNGNDQYVFFRGDNNDTILDAENPLEIDGGGGEPVFFSSTLEGGFEEGFGDEDLIWEVQASEAPSNDTLLFKNDIGLEDLEAFWATDIDDWYNETVNDLMIRINPVDGSGATADRQGHIQTILGHYQGQLYRELEAEELEEYSDKALRHLVYEIDLGYSWVTRTSSPYTVFSCLDDWSRQAPYFRDYVHGEDTVTIEQFYDERYTLENIVIEGDSYTLTNNDIMDLMSTGSAEMIRGVDWAANTIDAEAGNDAVIGGDLGDTITGSEGKDFIHGRMGDDTYLFEQGHGRDQLTDGPQDFLEVVEGARYWEGYRGGGFVPSSFAMEVTLYEPVSTGGDIGDPIFRSGGDTGAGDGGGYDRAVFGEGIHLRDIGFAVIDADWDPSLYVGYGTVTTDWDWDDVDGLTEQYGNAGHFGFSIGDNDWIWRSDPIYENDIHLPDQFTEDRAVEEFIAAGGASITWDDLQQGFYDAQNFIWDNEDALWEIEDWERNARGYVDRAIWSKWQRMDREVAGTEGNDQILAGDGDDTVIAGAGDDVIEAGFGTDVIDGGTGNDLYVYSRWDGFDTITDAGGSDTLGFGPDLWPNDLVATIDPDSGDLTLGVIDLVDQYWFEYENDIGPYRPDPAEMVEKVIISNFWSLDGRVEEFFFSGNFAFAASDMDLYNYLFTSEGDDEIFGLEGDNEICAQAGDDIITLGDGNHEVMAGNGDDVVTLGLGNHYVIGGGGNDIVYSSDGSDWIESGCGNDVIFAGGGDDEIYTWGESNTVYAGNGDDKIFTDGMIDHIYGGAGNDTIVSNGEEGGDHFYHIGPGDGHDTVHDFGGIDALVVEGGYTLGDAFIQKHDQADPSLYDVFVALPDGTTATLKDWSLPQNKIENIVFDDGSSQPVDSLFLFQSRNDTVALEEDGAAVGVVETAFATGTVAFALSRDSENGSFVLNDDGFFTYTPEENFFGDDTVQVTVTDTGGAGGGVSDVATLRFVVSPVNDAPVVTDPSQAYTLKEIREVRGLIEASDVDGDELSFSVEKGPAHGAFLLDDTGSWTYTPDDLYIGDDRAVVEVSDGNGGLSQAELFFEVLAAPPVVEDFTVDLEEDTIASGDLAVVNPGGGMLTYSVTQPAQHGRLEIDHAGRWTYTPEADFNGGDSGQITVTDEYGFKDTAKVDFTVAPVNDAPVVPESLQYVLFAAAQQAGSVPAEDVDGDTLAFAAVVAPAYGAFDIDENGRWTYTPDADFAGEDRVQVEVSDGNGGTVKTDLLFKVNVFEGGTAVVGKGGTGTILMDGISKDDLALTRAQDDLFIAVRDRGSMMLAGYFAAPENGVNVLQTLEGPLHLDKERIADVGPGCWWRRLTDQFGRWGIKNLIYGSSKSETLFGAEENDVLFGADGNDGLYGGSGNDTLVGGNGKDHLWGWDGDDTLYGDKGRGFLFGGRGDDALIGGEGNDRLDGGSGDDWLFGDEGDDRIDGGNGDDILVGGAGDDVLDGGRGDDIYRFGPGDGKDRVSDRDGGWCWWKKDSGHDTVRFDDGVSRESVAIFMRHKDLYLQYGDEDIVKIDQQLHCRGGIERLELADGSYLTDADIDGIIQQMAAYAVKEGICLRSVQDVRNNEDLMTLVADSWNAA